MKEPIVMTHVQMLDKLFSALDKRILNRNGKSVLKGFWQSGDTQNGFVPSYDNPPESQQIRHMGFWKASMLTPYGAADVLAAVLGGNTRVGVSLPLSFVQSQPDASDFVSRLYDGQPSKIQRQIGVTMLYDWGFKDDPFSAEWMLRCTHEDFAYDILENHFLWLVLHILEGTQRTISACTGDETPVIGNRYLTPDEAEEYGLTISSCFEMEMESGLKKITMVRPENGHISESDMTIIQRIVDERP